MKKIATFVVVLFASMACLMIALNYISYESEAATDTVDLEINVQEYLSFSITSGDAINFGNFNPGTPICSSTATVASVTTNAANGYTLGLHDGSATNSAMSKGGLGVVYIADYAGTIAEPTTWTGTGLGVTNWAADTSKNTTRWGAGATVCDALNEYAGVPETATTAHTVTGFREGADTSSWGWKIDAPNAQETGSYEGTVTFTATGVIS